MQRRTTQMLGSTVMLLLVLAAAGCGGKKKSAETTSTTAATTTTVATTTSESGTTTSGVSGLATLANCKQLASLESSVLQALQGTEGNVSKEVALLKKFADQTPADIRPDFQTLAQALGDASGALKGVKLNSGQSPDSATLSKLMKALASPKVTAAEQHISAWAAKNCHG